MSRDKSMFPKSGSGVTVETSDGKYTLEEFVDKEQADEDTKDKDDSIREQRKIVKGRVIKVRYKSRKDRPSRGRTLSRLEINQQFWERGLREMKNDEPLSKKVIAAMVDGEWLTARGVEERIKKVTGSANKGVSWTLTTMRRSDLGKFMEMRATESKRGAKEYRLAPALIASCDKETIYRLTLKREFTVTPDSLAEEFPEIAEYLKTQAMAAPAEPEAPTEVEIEQERRTAIEEALSQVLGVNVNVSGKVEVTFRFVIG